METEGREAGKQAEGNSPPKKKTATTNQKTKKKGYQYA